MQRVKDRDERLWYIAETLANGWSKSVLLAMIQSGAHRRKGRSITNFERLLPAPQSDLVRNRHTSPQETADEASRMTDYSH
jgi:predicted nuclease of restriction endonuclease-like (RecB) superfamily